MQTAKHPSLLNRLRPTVRGAFLGATAMMLFAYSSASASADELSELKAKFEAMQQRIEQLEARQQAASPASAKAVSSGNKKISLEVSGQVNRAALMVDDGDRTKFFHVDNDNSSTRVRFVGKGRLNQDFSVGALVEVQFESNSTANIDIDQDGEVGTDSFTQRHLTVYLDSKRLGRLWLGQGDTASNGTSEVDLSGTSVVAYSGIADLAGGISFKNSATQVKLVTIGSAFSQFDGLSRRDRVRYDTPTMSGFKGSTSFIQGDAWDAALRYSADYGAIGTKISAAIAYAAGGQRFDFNQVNGSVSALHSSGLSLTLAAGTQDLDKRVSGDDPVNYYIKGGYQIKPFRIGKTYLSADYATTDDLAAVGDEANSWGVFMVQKIDKIATELYLGYRNHELDRTGASIDDISVVVAGLRVKF